jgi:hypothetical protein
MKLPRTFLFLTAGLLLALPTTPANAENWTTTDGKVYQDVQVIHAEPDAVTILHHDGGALVPLAQLPADLQQRFHYDVPKAEAAADRRAKDESDSARALQAERREAWQMRQTDAQAGDADTNASNGSSSDEAPTESAVSTSTQTTHYSIDDIAGSGKTLRRDLSEAGYHSMAQLAYTVRSGGLRSDASDANHHSISEIGGLAP